MTFYQKKVVGVDVETYIEVQDLGAYWLFRCTAKVPNGGEFSETGETQSKWGALRKARRAVKKASAEL